MSRRLRDAYHLVCVLGSLGGALIVEGAAFVVRRIKGDRSPRVLYPQFDPRRKDEQ
jgi:hypothetical protein